MARQPLRKKRSDPAGDILRAAERLFGRDGIRQVSLRQISAEAGQKNIFAVQYYFGDKDQLIQAIFAKYLPSINRRRYDILRSISGNETVAGVIKAIYLPIVEEIDESGIRSYARFLAQVVSDLQVVHHWVRASDLVPSIAASYELMYGLCPDIERSLLERRLTVINVMVLQAIYTAEEQSQDLLEFDRQIDDIFEMARGALISRVEK